MIPEPEGRSVVFVRRRQRQWSLLSKTHHPFHQLQRGDPGSLLILLGEPHTRASMVVALVSRSLNPLRVCTTNAIIAPLSLPPFGSHCRKEHCRDRAKAGFQGSWLTTPTYFLPAQNVLIMKTFHNDLLVIIPFF